MHSTAKIYVAGHRGLAGRRRACHYRDCKWVHSPGIALARGIALLGSSRVRQVFNLDRLLQETLAIYRMS